MLSQTLVEMKKEIAINQDIWNKIQSLPPFTREECKKMLDEATARVKKNLDIFKNDTMPRHSSEKNVYPVDTNHDWSSSFWCGILWLAYEYTSDEIFKQQALIQCQSFRERYIQRRSLDNHDTGFLYTLSCAVGYQLTGEKWLKDIAVGAADILILRYKKDGGFIQSWGDNGEEGYYMLIVDSLMNLSLLFWASEVTGDPKYAKIANQHAETCAKTVLRRDGSTYHAFYFDRETGKPDHGETAQGFSDDSTWARGQSWAIYGFSIAYAHTGNSKFLECSHRASTYFLNHLRDDFLCYWDLCFKKEDHQLLDSSASAIAACGLMDYAERAQDNMAWYRHAAGIMLRSLYQVCGAHLDPKSNGLLLHGVYSIPHKLGVDECCIWGDYFYMEALLRIWKGAGGWKMYW